MTLDPDKAGEILVRAKAVPIDFYQLTAKPLGMIGATSIEGSIDPADLVEQRKAFVSQWLGRLSP